MEKKGDDQTMEKSGGSERQPSTLSPVAPLTHEAYGGGMYGKDDDNKPRKPSEQPASVTQSADGLEEAVMEPKHKPPPSTGDRDLDITGQSYIQ